MIETEKTTEQISPTEVTIEPSPTLADVMLALDGIAKRLDAHDIQFEAIRAGIAGNNIAFERLAGKVYLMSANLTEMQEEMRQTKKELV